MNGWSWALKDYWYHNITTYLTNPINKVLADIVDPFGKYLLLYSTPHNFRETLMGNFLNPALVTCMPIVTNIVPPNIYVPL